MKHPSPSSSGAASRAGSRRLRAGFSPLFIALSLLPCLAGAGVTFTFVQLCDTQLGLTVYKEDICSLRQAVKQINRIARAVRLPAPVPA